MAVQQERAAAPLLPPRRRVSQLLLAEARMEKYMPVRVSGVRTKYRGALDVKAGILKRFMLGG